ncbi:MAG TPA: 50S ribosomal protein L32 [Planctomycetota bacterium]|jgi:large subunit ribosomal protein L32|nr:50S ribosomal protein L32 [Planctomycetota bacterium]
MAVPKRRTSKMRKGTRRAHDSIAVPNVMRCSRCKTPIERHTICPECGYYRGKPAITVEEGV